MNLKELDKLIEHLKKNNETLLVSFYENKRRQLIQKMQYEIDKKIWNLVK